MRWGQSKRGCLHTAQILRNWLTGTGFSTIIRRPTEVFESLHSSKVAIWHNCAVVVHGSPTKHPDSKRVPAVVQLACLGGTEEFGRYRASAMIMSLTTLQSRPLSEQAQL